MDKPPLPDETSAASLRLGQLLSSDVYDSDGQVLLKAGNLVTAKFLADLQQTGVHEVYLRRDPRLADPDLAPYDQEAQRQLEQAFIQASATIMDIVTQLRTGQVTRTDEVEGYADVIRQQASKDKAVVIASCMNSHANTEVWDDALSRRGSKMSALAIVTAVQMGLTQSQCIAAGVAGSLHDVSLYGRPDSFFAEDFEEHPTHSLAMLDETYGLTDEMKVLIGQVHEQCDGSGFPRGLHSFRLHPVSRILNLIDAYLTLVEPLPGVGQAYPPADALAYLVQQAIYGYFDAACVRALILASSVYPVGTDVVMDDGSIATVMRSAGPAYTSPIVKQSDVVIDLRKAPIAIVQPTESSFGNRRLPKSALVEVLWRRVA